jgi:hypothetical protein
VGKLSLLGPLLHVRGPSRLTTNAMGFEAGGHPCAILYPCASSAILSLHPSLRLEKRKRDGKRRKRGKKEIERNTRILKVLPSLPPRDMVKQDWTPSTIMPGHLEKLMKQGFMVAAELKACCVPGDLTFPAPAEGYVASFVAFYEWIFSMPPHRFLRSLLWYYSLELHYLTPSGVLRIAAFVTLCEAYLGINLELYLWKYFFRVQCMQYSEAELMISEVMVIHVKVRHRVDPYLEIPMPR